MYRRAKGRWTQTTRAPPHPPNCQMTNLGSQNIHTSPGKETNLDLQPGRSQEGHCSNSKSYWMLKTPYKWVPGAWCIDRDPPIKRLRVNKRQQTIRFRREKEERKKERGTGRESTEQEKQSRREGQYQGPPKKTGPGLHPGSAPSPETSFRPLPSPPSFFLPFLSSFKYCIEL